MRLTPYFLLVPCALGLLFSCAQTGTLTGGLKDEKPPQMLSCVPANYSTHFNSDRIQITFDEYFSLKDISKQLVVSPPMKTKPEFKIKGRLLSIRFTDTLQPDRTYAINFGDALVDLNEANPIKNFQIVFSTGNTIDSLETSGIVWMPSTTSLLKTFSLCFTMAMPTACR
ncbi:MAG: Ig-like domain-containing protein [Bacteroidales bacterium]|nr:Ig-like domain-containing protein [Bacteroidales bacterium]